MKTARNLLSILSLVLLGAGFLSSAYVSLSGGDVEAYGRVLDQPAVRWLAMFLLLAAIALSLVRERSSP